MPNFSTRNRVESKHAEKQVEQTNAQRSKHEPSPPLSHLTHTHTHARTHARTHATHARTHAHTKCPKYKPAGSIQIVSVSDV